MAVIIRDMTDPGHFFSDQRYKGMGKHLRKRTERIVHGPQAQTRPTTLENPLEKLMDTQTAGPRLFIFLPSALMNTPEVAPHVLPSHNPCQPKPANVPLSLCRARRDPWPPQRGKILACTMTSLVIPSNLPNFPARGDDLRVHVGLEVSSGTATLHLGLGRSSSIFIVKSLVSLLEAALRI